MTDPLSAVIGVGGGLINTLLGGIFSSNQQSSSLAMNRENQRWQAEEWSRRYATETGYQTAMYNRQFQDWFTMQQRQYQDNLSLQRIMADYNMNLESQEYDRRMNAYQTPEAQARLLQEAGFNPLLAATGVQGTQPNPTVSNGNGMSSPSAPSFGQSPNPGNPDFQMVTPAQVGNSAMLEAVSGMIEKLSVAMKNGMDVHTSRTLLEEQLRSFILKNNGQELLNVSQQIDNFIAENTKGTKVKKIFQDYQNSVVTEILLKNQSDESVSRSLLNFSNKFLADLQGKIDGEKLIQLQILTENYQDIITAWKRNVNSSTSKNLASSAESYAHIQVFKSEAAYKDALTQTENAMRQGNISLQTFAINMQGIAAWNMQEDQKKRSAYLIDEYSAYHAQLKQAGLLTDKMAAELEKAKKENNWYEFNQIISAVGVAAGAYSNIAGGSSMMLNSLSGAQRVKIAERAQETYEKQVRQQGRNLRRSVFDSEGNIQGWYVDEHF